jgi:ABC-type nitrate/sulfonate/bicarbonate transport system substrate-binding protein
MKAFRFVSLLLLAALLAGCATPPTAAPTTVPAPVEPTEAPPEPAVPEPEVQPTKDLSELIPVRVAWQPYNSVLFYTANELGLWEQCGLDVEAIKFTAGPPQFAAIASDSVDLSLFGTAGMVFGLAQGLDMVNFYIQIESSYNDGLVVHPESGIEAIEDLVGKTVAYKRGTSAHLGLVRLLEDYGMTIDQLDLIDMDIPNLVPAFINRDIDAAYSWEPWIAKMEDEGGIVLARTNEAGLYTSDNWAARRAWAEASPEAMRRVFCVIDQAHAAYMANPSIGYEAFAEETGIPLEMAQRIMEMTPVLSLEQLMDPAFELSFTSPDGAQAMVQEVIDFLYDDQALIQTRPDASLVVDGSYLVDYMDHRAEYVGE